MKKIYKNIIRIVVALSVLLLMGCSSGAITDPMAAQAVAKKHYAKLLEELEKSVEASIYDDGIDLNKYYGGAYLDDNKRLNICCTTDDNRIADLFREAAGSSDVVIKSVKFTKDELYQLKDEFSEKLREYLVDKELNEEEKRFINDIRNCYVDIILNHVTIGIIDLDKEKEKKFHDFFDFFPIGSVEFAEAEIPINLTED